MTKRKVLQLFLAVLLIPSLLATTALGLGLTGVTIQGLSFIVSAVSALIVRNPASTVVVPDVVEIVGPVVTDNGAGEAQIDIPAADYLVGTAHGGLTGEIVVGTIPGGQLGNTWADPQVDESHGGASPTTHASVQSAAESTAAAALSTHVSDTTAVHGFIDTALILVEFGTLSAAPSCTVARTGFVFTLSDAVDVDDCTTGGNPGTENSCICDGENYVDYAPGGTVTETDPVYESDISTAAYETNPFEIRKAGETCGVTGACLRAGVTSANEPVLKPIDVDGSDMGTNLNAPADSSVTATKAAAACVTLVDGATGKTIFTPATAGCGTIQGLVTFEDGANGNTAQKEVTASPYTMLASDCGKIVNINVSGAVTVNMIADPFNGGTLTTDTCFVCFSHMHASSGKTSFNPNDLDTIRAKGLSLVTGDALGLEAGQDNDVCFQGLSVSLWRTWPGTGVLTDEN